MFSCLLKENTISQQNRLKSDFKDYLKILFIFSYFIIAAFRLILECHFQHVKLSSSYLNTPHNFTKF